MTNGPVNDRVTSGIRLLIAFLSCVLYARDATADLAYVADCNGPRKYLHWRYPYNIAPLYIDNRSGTFGPPSRMKAAREVINALNTTANGNFRIEAYEASPGRYGNLRSEMWMRPPEFMPGKAGDAAYVKWDRNTCELREVDVRITTGEWNWTDGGSNSVSPDLFATRKPFNRFWDMLASDGFVIRETILHELLHFAGLQHASVDYRVSQLAYCGGKRACGPWINSRSGRRIVPSSKDIGELRALYGGKTTTRDLVVTNVGATARVEVDTGGSPVRITAPTCAASVGPSLAKESARDGRALDLSGEGDNYCATKHPQRQQNQVCRGDRIWFAWNVMNYHSSEMCYRWRAWYSKNGNLPQNSNLLLKEVTGRTCVGAEGERFHTGFVDFPADNPSPVGILAGKFYIVIEIVPENAFSEVPYYDDFENGATARDTVAVRAANNWMPVRGVLSLTPPGVKGCPP